MESKQEIRSIEKVEEIEGKVNSVVPSTTSSPSHEFSFTIPLHSSTTATTTTKTTTTTTIKQPPIAIDLSPADEIFFHGHLLPLHFLSHLHPSSPRTSVNSLDSFTLPVRDILPQDKPITNEDDNGDKGQMGRKYQRRKESFSLFKWKKESSDERENQDHHQQQQQQQQQKRKLKFDVSQFIKKYIKMVKPFLLSNSKGGGRRKSYSFSGTLTPREKRENMVGRRRGEFSAPASVRTSPTNSRRHLTTAGIPSPASDSTMEELQAAIQAAIAHCKNSIATDEKSQELSVPVN